MIVLEKYNLQKTNSVIKLPSLNYSRFADCLESLQYAKPYFFIFSSTKSMNFF